jgi:uncharacterized membrane protein
MTPDNYGRDHHPRSFSIWMAGGGVKPGIVYGETDEFGYNIIKDPVHVHDFQATVLHQLGLNHAGLMFLVFCLLFENRIQVPAWLHVAGRMHPLVLHFPIVFLLIYLVTLWLPGSAADQWAEAFGLIAALSAIVTAILGFILALETVHEGTTFLWHKWGGIALAFAAAGLYYGRNIFSRYKRLSRTLSLAVALLLLATGHWGANLTHGENYLLEPLATAKAPVAFDAAFAFANVVQPVLQNKCGSCHNAGNKKGGLALDDTTGMLEGGKGGALYIAGKPDSSLLLLRILLPVEHKKHMAPANKPQLTEQEVQLLRFWVKAGAPLNKKVAELPPTDSFRWAAALYLAPSASNGTTAYTFPPAAGATIKALNTNYRRVAPVGTGSPALTVAFYGRDGYSDMALQELLPVKEQITDLNLAKLPVTDTALRIIQQFSNLEKLNLNYTDVTDRGIRQLTSLKKLKEVALSGTAVTFKALEPLTQLPELSAVYIWNTTLDSLNLAALQKKNSNIRFVTGYNTQKDTTVYTLTPPTIKTPEGIFEHPTMLEMKHGVRGVTIRYTVDGSEPCSKPRKWHRRVSSTRCGASHPFLLCHQRSAKRPHGCCRVRKIRCVRCICRFGTCRCHRQCRKILWCRC